MNENAAIYERKLGMGPQANEEMRPEDKAYMADARNYEVIWMKQQVREQAEVGSVVGGVQAYYEYCKCYDQEEV